MFTRPPCRVCFACCGSSQAWHGRMSPRTGAAAGMYCPRANWACRRLHAACWGHIRRPGALAAGLWSFVDFQLMLKRGARRAPWPRSPCGRLKPECVSPERLALPFRRCNTRHGRLIGRSGTTTPHAVVSVPSSMAMGWRTDLHRNASSGCTHCELLWFGDDRLAIRQL